LIGATLVNRPHRNDLENRKVAHALTADFRLPYVSIIVAFHNQASYLRKCLLSLVELDYPEDSYEIVLVDDGSSDDWKGAVSDLLQSCRRRLKLLSENDVGPAASRNSGISISEGSIIAITDADCVVDKQWLKHHVKHYSDPKVGGVEGKVETDWDLLSRPRRTAPAGFRYVTANMSYRRRTLEDVDLFDERFRWKEDDELAYRIMKRGWRMASDPAALVYHPVKTLSLKGLFTEGLKHQYDVLFYQKHPDIAAEYFRLSRLGPIAVTPVFIFIAGTLFVVAALIAAAFYRSALSLLFLAFSVCLFSLVCFRSNRKELKISLFWMAVFAVFMEIGRMRGSFRFRKILL